MAKEEKGESAQKIVTSYFKSLTLEKKYGTTGSIEMEHGAVYIGEKSYIFFEFVIKSSNQIFQGDLDCNGVRIGMGHLEIPNGSTYDGSFNKVIIIEEVRGRFPLCELIRVCQTGLES